MRLKIRIQWPSFRKARPKPTVLSVVPAPVPWPTLSATPAPIWVPAPGSLARPGLPLDPVSVSAPVKSPILGSGPAPKFASVPPASVGAEPAPIQSPFLSTLMEHAAGSAPEATKEQTVRQIHAPKLNATRQVGPGILRKTFSWLHKNYSPTAKKQLRVSESVSLGEKRFVAIIHADGQKFLIGGGASGVSLLTQLGEQEASVHPNFAIRELTERSA